MEISVENLLYNYFHVEQLKDVLYEIGIPYGHNKEESVNRILDNWIERNREWYDLLEFLDRDDLRDICDDFNIEYDNSLDEDELMMLIEDNKILKIPRKTFPKKPKPHKSINVNNEQYIPNNLHIHVPDRVYNASKGKLNRIIILTMVIWFIFGMSMGVLALDGYFINESTQPISVSKEYLVHIETMNESVGSKSTSQGITAFVTLKGNILLTSTQFSAQNKIKVDVDLAPADSLEDHDEKIIETLPEPFWIIIPDAVNIDDQLEQREYAIINLTKSLSSPKITGSGTIIFSKGGNNEIYIVEPRELHKISDLITEKSHKPVTFTYDMGKGLEEGVNVTNTVYFEDDSTTRIDAPEFSILSSENIQYFADIKTSDSLRSLENTKQTSFSIWMAGTIGVGTAILFRKH